MIVQLLAALLSQRYLLLPSHLTLLTHVPLIKNEDVKQVMLLHHRPTATTNNFYKGVLYRTITIPHRPHYASLFTPGCHHATVSVAIDHILRTEC